MHENHEILSVSPSYFAMMPHMADDDLDPYEYRLYGHYLRVCGFQNKPCKQSIRKIAEITRMSVGKVSETRKKLEEKGYISVKSVSERETIQVTILDIMPENVARYSTQKRAKCSPHEQQCSPHEQQCSPHERKNKYKEEQEKNTGGHADAPVGFVVSGDADKEKPSPALSEAIKSQVCGKMHHPTPLRKSQSRAIEMPLDFTQSDGFSTSYNNNPSPAELYLDDVYYKQYAITVMKEESERALSERRGKDADQQRALTYKVYSNIVRRLRNVSKFLEYKKHRDFAFDLGDDEDE